MKVRIANSVDEIEGLKSLAEEWKEEWNGEGFGIELVLGTFFSHLADMVNDADKELFLLLGKDEVIGFMGAVIFQSPLGNQNFCQERFWFVSGKHRGRGTMLLLRAVKDWGKGKGCSHRLMTASWLASGLHDRLCRFY